MLKDPKFWLNLAMVFLGTSWVPILNVNVATAEGETIKQLIPIYKCYQYVLVEPNIWIVAAIIIHLMVVVGISIAFRRAMEMMLLKTSGTDHSGK